MWFWEDFEEASRNCEDSGDARKKTRRNIPFITHPFITHLTYTQEFLSSTSQNQNFFTTKAVDSSKISLVHCCCQQQSRAGFSREGNFTQHRNIPANPPDTTNFSNNITNPIFSPQKTHFIKQPRISTSLLLPADNSQERFLSKITTKDSNSNSLLQQLTTVKGRFLQDIPSFPINKLLFACFRETKWTRKKLLLIITKTL